MMDNDERTDPDVGPSTEQNGRRAIRLLSSLLSDTSFRKALVRLVNHVHEESGREFTAAAEDECLEKLAYISFLQVPSVMEAMVKLNKKPLGSHILAFAHNTQGECRQSVLYLDADACLDPHIFMDGFLLKLVSAVQFVLGESMDGVLLYHMLKCPRQADSILDEAGIKKYDTARFCIPFNPTLGSFVPLKNHGYLEDDFHEFSVGECVAFEIYDPFLDHENSEGNSRPVYVYATVLHEVFDSAADTIFAKRYCIDLGPDRGETVVSITRLYKIMDSKIPMFLRKEKREQNITITKEDEKQSQDKTPAQDEEQKSAAVMKPKGDQTLDLIMLLRELRQMLTEAWQVCKEQEFRCVTKRLAGKWQKKKQHHRFSRDKEEEAVYTRLIQAIPRYADLLSQGKSLDQDDFSAGDTEQDSVDQLDGQKAWIADRRPFLEFQCQGKGLDQDDFSAGDTEQDSVDQLDGQKARIAESYGGFKSVSNPQPDEGLRWLRTAQSDLTAAIASKGVCPQGRNWVCFLCHQAMEKALKGLLYMRDADNPILQSHSLHSLARQVCDDRLLQMAKQMHSWTGPHTHMRYPDVLTFPSIPADVYTEENVHWACKLAQDAVQRVDQLMQTQRFC